MNLYEHLKKIIPDLTPLEIQELMDHPFVDRESGEFIISDNGKPMNNSECLERNKMEIKTRIEQAKLALEIPEHECNPPILPPLEKGYIRTKRAALFGECSQCYKKLKFSQEQLIARLGLINEIIEKIKE